MSNVFKLEMKIKLKKWFIVLVKTTYFLSPKLGLYTFNKLFKKGVSKTIVKA